MLKAIAVDDEFIALKRFERIVKDIDTIELIYTCTDSNEALEFLSNTKENIDIAFLDIEMPILSGLELAEKISFLNINIDVIFLSAHDKYALDAFKVHAVNYLLKPIDKEELQKLFDHINNKRNNTKKIIISNEKELILSVKAFGGFECILNNGKIINWRTKKAEELFAFLLHYQGKGVSREVIINTLWPDMDQKKAYNNLYTTSYYVRKKLDQNDIGHIFVRDKDKYLIKIKNKQTDFIEFSKQIETIKKDTKLGKLLEISKMYKGQYFKDKSYDWANTYAIWLENQYTYLQLEITKRYIEDDYLQAAAQSLKSLIYYNPYCELAYEKIIKIMVALSNKVQVKQYYKDYLKLVGDLEIKPSEEIKKKVIKCIS